MNNYAFSLNQKQENQTRWRCSNYSRFKCKAVIYSRGRTVTLVHSHNHEPELDSSFFAKNGVKHLVTILPGKSDLEDSIEK